MEIVALPGSTNEIIVSPLPSLLTVCYDNLTAKQFIQISNHEGKEVASPFIGATPPHLDQSGRVAGPSFPLLLITENIKSLHVDFESTQS